MKAWEVSYYVDDDGVCEIEGFIDRLSERNSAKFLAWVQMLRERGPNLPRPYADLLRDGIHELRIKLSGEQVRGLYLFLRGNEIILTHTFKKTTS